MYHDCSDSHPQSSSLCFTSNSEYFKSLQTSRGQFLIRIPSLLVPFERLFVGSWRHSQSFFRISFSVQWTDWMRGPEVGRCNKVYCTCSQDSTSWITDFPWINTLNSLPTSLIGFSLFYSQDAVAAVSQNNGKILSMYPKSNPMCTALHLPLLASSPSAHEQMQIRKFLWLMTEAEVCKFCLIGGIAWLQF